MPADDCLWLDDDQRLLPAGTDLRKEDPKGAVDRSDLRLGPSLGGGGKLLAQSELDQGLLIPASEQGWYTAKQECREVEW